MDSSLILVVVFFLVGMALLAGVCIGLVIGLALGSRNLQSPAAASASTTLVTPITPSSGTAAPLATMPAVARQPRQATAWSVALAFGVIIICCACTFITAALATTGR